MSASVSSTALPSTGAKPSFLFLSLIGQAPIEQNSWPGGIGMPLQHVRPPQHSWPLAQLNPIGEQSPHVSPRPPSHVGMAISSLHCHVPSSQQLTPSKQIGIFAGSQHGAPPV